MIYYKSCSFSEGSNAVIRVQPFTSFLSSWVFSYLMSWSQIVDSLYGFGKMLLLSGCSFLKALDSPFSTFSVRCKQSARPVFPFFQVNVQVSRPLVGSALRHVYMPLEGSNPALAQHLQPVLILEPHTGLLHPQFVSRELCKYVS